MFATIFYHYIRYLIAQVDAQMEKESFRNIANSPEEAIFLRGKNSTFSSTAIHSNAGQLRLLHAFLSAVNYGLALMLMLVAMTYNPSLFVALVVGYGLGDYMFHIRIPSGSVENNCH